MSDYLERAISTGVLSDKTWLKLSAVVGEHVKVTGEHTTTLVLRTVEQSEISDTLSGESVTPTVDTLRIWDSVASQKLVNQQVFDDCKIQDSVQLSKVEIAIEESIVHIFDEVLSTVAQGVVDTLKVSVTNTKVGLFKRVTSELLHVSDFNSAVKVSPIQTSDTCRISDMVSDATTFHTVESVRVQDSLSGQRFTSTVTNDSLKVSDKLISVDVLRGSGSTQMIDAVTSKLVALHAISDNIRVTDELVIQIGYDSQITSSAKVESETWLKVVANANTVDWVFADGEILDRGESGSAWTAPVDGWHMSRYSDFSFQQLVNLDGKLFGVADGIYDLSESNDMVHGRLVTGKLDMSGRHLVHPTSAFLEYELDGTLTTSVTTTQSGDKEVYQYVLPNENAKHLTNGRVTFGRGLRGRHFSFEIGVSGKHAHINDFVVQCTDTNRRI